MERSEFIAALESQFPDAFAQIDQRESGLLHCEVGAFRRFVEEKMDNDAAWYCEKAFRFIEQCLEEAGPALKNAIEVSFIYDLAIGAQSTQRHKIVKERAPKFIKDKMAHANVFWK